MGDLGAQGERSVVVGRDVINGIIVTGDKNKFFIGKYSTLRDAYIYPGEVFDRVDLDQFVGREWLLDMIDSFLLKYDRGYFILEAEAGFGKTTFMAWLVKERNYIHNFCELTPGPEKIGDALKNLASQLILAYDLSIEAELSVDTASRPGFLYNILDKASKKLSECEKIVLVIDALDQAGKLEGQNVLGLPKTLPEGVFIIASQRPVGVALNVDKAIIRRDVCNLSEYKEKNEDDIRRFLRNVATWPEIETILQDQKYSPDKFVTTLMEKCQGVWIYLHYVIPEIESGERSVFDLDSLPEGLFSYYFEYWGRWREDNHHLWCKNYLPLLATLAATQEPVPVERLKKWTSSETTKQELRWLLNEQWRPYMIISSQAGQEQYRFYHQSLKDLFSGRVETKNLEKSEEDFLDELKEASLEAHNRIVKFYLSAWGGLNNGLPGLQNLENLKIDDGYGLRYLAFHLEASGRIDDLHCLLSLETTEQRNAWYEAKNAYGNLSDYMIDVSKAWRLAENVSESKIKNGEISLTIGLETLYALISASVNSLSANIPPELLIALIKEGIWTLNKGLAYARQVPEFEHRVEALISITVNLSQYQLSDSQREEILKEALNAAIKIQDELSRAKALAGIAPHLPEPMMKEALNAAIKIHNDFCRAEALAGIAPNLPESMMKEALNAVIQIQDVRYRTNALAEIAPHLPESMMKEALNAAMQIRDDWSRAKALAGIAPHLPESMIKDVLKEALNAAMQIRDDWSRAKALAGIAPHLPEPMMKEALNAVIKIQDEFFRADALTGIAPHLPESMMKEALDAVIKIQDVHYRTNALAEIAPHLPESMMKEALDAAMQIQDVHYRTNALAEIAPHLPESMIKDVLKEALDAAILIQVDEFRAEALARIAPHLPESMIKEALDAAIKIQDELYRAKALAGIAPLLPESMMKEALKEALNAAIKIQNEESRADALAEILSLNLSIFPLDLFYAIWVKILHGSISSRSNLFTNLGKMMPVIYKLGGVKALNETFYAIQKVAKWWP